MSTQTPRRWLETDDLDEALRTDLAAAAADDVGYDVTAAVARFEAALARGGPPGDGGGSGSASGSAGASAGTAAGGKGLALVVGLCVVVGGGAIAWTVAGDGSRTASAPSSAVGERELARPPAALVERQVVAEAKAPVEAEAPAGVEPPSATEHPAKATTEAAVPEPTTPRTGRTKPRPSITAPEPTRPAEDDRLQREMRATDRARQALASDPARALSLARKADAEFPEGLFVEDREGIAILALFALDRTDEARRRAAAFLRAHPRSSHADKIRAAMDDEADKP